MKFRWIMAAGIILLILLFFCAVGIGAGSSSFSDSLAALFGSAPEPLCNIVRKVRFPRILASILAGGILGSAGCVMQSVFRNPLASPHVLGTVNASALGAVTGLLIGSAAGFSLTVPMSIFFGVASVLILLLPARFRNHFSAALILAGIAVNAFASALTSGILFLADERLQGIVFWLLGGFWRADADTVFVLAPAALGCIAPLFFLHREMDVLALGESAARHSGVHVVLIQTLSILLAAVMTAFCVSFCGVIGFVGLLVPHFARLCGMVHFREQLALSLLGGALLLLLADTVARTAAAPMEIPVGIFTSLLGAPFFLYLLLKKAGEV